MHQAITLVGNVGKDDPIMRYMPSGEPVTNFSMATNRKWSANGEKKEETIWWKVAIFGKAAEAVNEYLKKGSKVMVNGRLNAPKIWTDNKGQARVSLEVTANAFGGVIFLSSRGDAPAHSDSGEPDGESEVEAPRDGPDEL